MLGPGQLPGLPPLEPALCIEYVLSDIPLTPIDLSLEIRIL